LPVGFHTGPSCGALRVECRGVWQRGFQLISCQTHQWYQAAAMLLSLWRRVVGLHTLHIGRRTRNLRCITGVNPLTARFDVRSNTPATVSSQNTSAFTKPLKSRIKEPDARFDRRAQSAPSEMHLHHKSSFGR
jgi:hypothetical protein